MSKHRSPTTVRTRKQWKRKTTLLQYFSVSDIVYKAASFTRHLLNHLFIAIGPLTLQNSCSLDFFNYESRLPILEFSGYHCSSFSFTDFI